MIHCCLCDHSHGETIAAHIRSHGLSLKEYVTLFPEMPIGALEPDDVAPARKPVRRSRIHTWWPVCTALVMLWNGTPVRDLGGRTVTGKVVLSRQYQSGYAIQDLLTGELYPTPTGWVRVRAPWIVSPNGWKIVQPITEKGV